MQTVYWPQDLQIPVRATKQENTAPYCQSLILMRIESRERESSPRMQLFISAPHSVWPSFCQCAWPPTPRMCRTRTTSALPSITARWQHTHTEVRQGIVGHKNSSQLETAQTQNWVCHQHWPLQQVLTISGQHLTHDTPQNKGGGEGKRSSTTHMSCCNVADDHANNGCSGG